MDGRTDGALMTAEDRCRWPASNTVITTNSVLRRRIMMIMTKMLLLLLMLIIMMMILATYGAKRSMPPNAIFSKLSFTSLNKGVLL